MKLSQLVLAVSSAITRVACTVQDAVVIPSLTTGTKLKAAGLSRAFQESDTLYWQHVDNVIAARELVRKSERNVDLAILERNAVTKALKAHNKAHSL
jgi:hypothetical protein